MELLPWTCFCSCHWCPLVSLFESDPLLLLIHVILLLWYGLALSEKSSSCRVLSPWVINLLCGGYDRQLLCSRETFVSDVLKLFKNLYQHFKHHCLFLPYEIQLSYGITWFVLSFLVFSCFNFFLDLSWSSWGQVVNIKGVLMKWEHLQGLFSAQIDGRFKI